jgi:hypothetical protein
MVPHYPFKKKRKISKGKKRIMQRRQRQLFRDEIILWDEMNLGDESKLASEGKPCPDLEANKKGD